MIDIRIVQLVDNTMAEHVYEVELLDGHTYKVWFSENYYQKLTDVKIAPEELVKKSFEFLLEREGPESILSEFELSDIQHYFPEYEEQTKSML